MIRKLILGILLIVTLPLSLSAQDAPPLRNVPIAFERSGNLYVLEVNSNSLILVEELPSGIDGYEAVWSPDGTMLAYTLPGDHPSGTVKTLKVWDGTQAFDIATSGVNREMPINWTQDGHLIYFAFPENIETELARVYTVAPTATARPQLISDEVPLCIEYSQVGTLVQLVEKGLIYTSGCLEYTDDGYTGYNGVIYQPPTRNTITFGYGLTETRLLSQDQSQLIGVLHGPKGDTSIVRVDLTTMEETIERPLAKHLDNQSLYLSLALDNDGNVYYNVGRDTHDLLDTLSEEQLITFANPLRAYANLLGVYPDYLIHPDGRESALPHNTMGIARLTPKGRTKYMLEKLDVYDINMLQVVGQTLYFSVLNNSDQWLQALLDGTLPIDIDPDDPVESLEFELAPYIQRDVYALDLAVKGSVPVLIIENANQVVVGGH